MHLESESADRPFRNPKLIVSSVDQLLNEQNRKITDFQTSFDSLKAIKDELENCTFKNSAEVEEIAFGQLRLNEDRQKTASNFKEKEEENNDLDSDRDRDNNDDDDSVDDYGFDYDYDNYNERNRSPKDYSACDSECGYCGHCPYYF